MATRNIVPRATGEGSIGTPAKHWGDGQFDVLHLGGGDVGSYLAESTGYGIVSGCEPSISGLTVTVGAGVVHLAGGTRKEIPSTNITLDPADSTNPRIDLVYITSAGVVAKVTGTAAASPSAPSVPTGGISVAQVNVAAGATTGTVTDSRGMLARFYNTGVVNVKDFGAVGDGVTDDTQAIQAVIDNNGLSTIFFPKGTYVISSTITTKHDGEHDVSLLLDRYAKIVPAGPMDVMISIGDTYDYDYIHNQEMGWRTRTYFIGGNVDGLGLANIGIQFVNYHDGFLSDVGIFNCLSRNVNIGNKNGVPSERRGEMYITNIHICNHEYHAVATNAYGVYNDGYDTQMHDCFIMGVSTGLYTSQAIFAERVHITAGYAYDGVAFDIDGGGNISQLTNTYADGYKCAYRLSGNVNLQDVIAFWYQDSSITGYNTVIDIKTRRGDKQQINVDGLRVSSAGTKVIILNDLPLSVLEYNNGITFKNLTINGYDYYSKNDFAFACLETTKPKVIKDDLSPMVTTKAYKVATMLVYGTEKAPSFLIDVTALNGSRRYELYAVVYHGSTNDSASIRKIAHFGNDNNYTFYIEKDTSNKWSSSSETTTLYNLYMSCSTNGETNIISATVKSFAVGGYIWTPNFKDMEEKNISELTPLATLSPS